MTGIQPKLLRSVIVLALFYGLIGLIGFMSMGPDAMTLWLKVNGTPPADPVTPLNILGLSLSIITARWLVVFPWLIGGVVAGFFLVWLFVRTLNTRYEFAGRQHKETYRGIGVTVSVPPSMPTPSMGNLNISIPRHVTKAHRPLLRDILNYLSQHKDAFVGNGHKGNLLEHTLNVINKAVDYPDADPLLILAAAAHDMGKVVSHVKQGKSWKRVSLHDKEGAKLLTSFPSWWEMDASERSILAHAVRYEHKPSSMPYRIPWLTKVGVERSKLLLGQLRDVDGEATAEEKHDVLEGIDVGEAAITAFLRAIPQMPFQVKGLNRSVKAAGWRDGDYLFLIEHRIRDISVDQLDDDFAAAMGGKYREKGHVSDFSLALFKAMQKKGWLITEFDTQKDGETVAERVPVEYPLWKINAGTMQFSGIVIIKLPEDLRHYYPKQSQYDVLVTGKLPRPSELPKGRAARIISRAAKKVPEKTTESPVAESSASDDSEADKADNNAIGNDHEETGIITVEEPDLDDIDDDDCIFD